MVQGLFFFFEHVVRIEQEAFVTITTVITPGDSTAATLYFQVPKTLWSQSSNPTLLLKVPYNTCPYTLWKCFLVSHTHPSHEPSVDQSTKFPFACPVTTLFFSSHWDGLTSPSLQPIAANKNYLRADFIKQDEELRIIRKRVADQGTPGNNIEIWAVMRALRRGPGLWPMGNCRWRLAQGQAPAGQAWAHLLEGVREGRGFRASLSIASVLSKL